jgi:hypothetical protein
MHHGMRAVALGLLIAGCHGSAMPLSIPDPPSLTLHVELAAPARPVGDLQIATASLHLRTLSAVSDRVAADGRTTLTDLDLAMGASLDTPISPAPPGLYSAVNAVLDDSAGPGVALAGAWGGLALHVQVASGPFDVDCPQPARLDPGGRIRLGLRADPSHWLDGIDLSAALFDSDDDGIVLSDYDNRAMAQAVLANVIGSLQLDCAPAD